MAAKKGMTLYIGLTLLVIGVIELLGTLNIWHIGKSWWLPILLIILGLLVITGAKGTVNIMGWICLVYGLVLLLMTIGLFQVAFLWQLGPVSFILFALILLL